MWRKRATFFDYETAKNLHDNVIRCNLEGRFDEAAKYARELATLTDGKDFNKQSPIQWKHFLKRR